MNLDDINDRFRRISEHRHAFDEQMLELATRIAQKCGSHLNSSSTAGFSAVSVGTPHHTLSSHLWQHENTPQGRHKATAIEELRNEYSRNASVTALEDRNHNRSPSARDASRDTENDIQIPDESILTPSPTPNPQGVAALTHALFLQAQMIDLHTANVEPLPIESDGQSLKDRFSSDATGGPIPKGGTLTRHTEPVAPSVDWEEKARSLLESGEWKAVKDSHGRTYYVNKKERLTCWNLAKELAKQAGA